MTQFGYGLPPDTSPEELARLAAERPDLWPAILQHPRAYPDLQRWIVEQQRAAPSMQPDPMAMQSDPMAPTQAAAFEPQATPFEPRAMPFEPQPAPFEPQAPSAQPRAPRRRKGLLVGILAGATALLLAGAGALLAFTSTWPFGTGGPLGGGRQATAAGQQEPTGFAKGLELMWRIDSDDYVTPNPSGKDLASSWLDWRPTRAAIAQYPAGGPVAGERNVVFTSRGEDSAQVMIDIATGETVWQGDGRGACAFDPYAEGDVFYCLDPDERSSTVTRVDEKGNAAEKRLDRAYTRIDVAKDRLVLSASDSAVGVAAYDRSFDELWTLQGSTAESSYGVDLGEKLTLVRGWGGWVLIDDAGRILGDGQVVSLYEGGTGSCDARLTASDRLVVSDADGGGSSCAHLEAGVAAWYYGNSLGEVEVFSVNGDDYVLVAEENGSELRQIGVSGKRDASLWTADAGRRDGVSYVGVATSLIGYTTGEDPLVVLVDGERAVSLDLATGDEVASWAHTPDGRPAHAGPTDFHETTHMLDPAQGVVFVNDAAFDARSGEQLWSAELPEKGSWWITRAGILVLEGGCDECSMAGGATSLQYMSLYGPDGSGGEPVSTSVGGRDGGRDGAEATPAASLPEGIPGCPGDTILLAWAEFEDGWVLVCGVDASTPSYVEVQLPGEKGTLKSKGASDPGGSTATAAVAWDEDLRRYTAQLDGGGHLTMDYDMGTMIVRGDDRKTVAQARFVRYIFVPLGEKVRTLQESAEETGAFDVQAPDESGEDQIRYMIEVLEKAYAGRALVKEALPKLQNCTASAGGYADTVAAMKSVRDNRAELLEALDAMPVDRIPDGDLLLDDLTEAIEYSHEANIEYVAWAEAANAKGCASLSSAGTAAAAASDAPKERFAERWNRVIAPDFGVRTFDAWYI